MTRVWLLALLASLVLAGCVASSGGSITADEALEAVRAENPLFADIELRDPDVIGQADWAEVSETADGWRVVIRIGWGDCPAGCINEHRWTFAVTPSGAVTLVEETGDELPDGGEVSGTVVAGPTCPVVTDPPDPSCDDRPVEGADLVVTTLDGVEVARTTSDRDGRFALQLAPGTYRLEPQPVEGLMGTPMPITVSVEWGTSVDDLLVVYDTGIR